MRDSFVFYRSFYEAMEGLSDAEKGQCFEALANYAINGEEPRNMTPVVRLFFIMARPQIDKNNQRFENGKNGGRSKNQTETKNKPNENQTETKPEANVNVNVNENVLEKDNLKVIQKEKTKIFQKPTIDEVEAYCQERNNGIDVARWFDYYTANGWKVGKNPMKDWRAAVRTWERGSVAAPASRKTADEDFYAQLNALGASND
jgi:hypothetical protein